MIRNRGIRNRKVEIGMTLLEVMIAVSIAAGIVALVYASSRDVNRVKALVEEDAERLREAQMALDRFARDVRSAHLSAHRRPMQPKTDTAFVGEDDPPIDRLSMSTFTNTHRRWEANDSDQAEVTYLGVEDPDHYGVFHLARRFSSRIDEKPLEGGVLEVLVHDVVEFDVEYYETAREEWIKDWDSTQPTAQPGRLPVQVRVRLTVLDRNNRETTLATQIPLEMRDPILMPGGFQ